MLCPLSPLGWQWHPQSPRFLYWSIGSLRWPRDHGIFRGCLAHSNPGVASPSETGGNSLAPWTSMLWTSAGSGSHDDLRSLQVPFCWKIKRIHSWVTLLSHPWLLLKRQLIKPLGNLFMEWLSSHILGVLSRTGFHFLQCRWVENFSKYLSSDSFSLNNFFLSSSLSSLFLLWVVKTT